MKEIEVIQNKNGYWETAVKPSEKELENYYAQLYFQTAEGAYEAHYSDDELTHFANENEIKLQVIQQALTSVKSNKKRFLDIGCGEGFTMDYFQKRNWDVLGLDYSIFGAETQNPAMVPYIIQGNIYESIQQLIGDNKKFEVITLLNVLEHVIDPIQLLNEIHKLLEEGGVLAIVVPNDFSILQDELWKDKKISRKFWLRYPDHLSYFTKESLIKSVETTGFTTFKCLSDFPIDYFLANPDSNYIEDGLKGKNCHNARIWLNNLQCKISIEKTINLYEAFSNLGLGRQISGYFIKS